MELVDKNIQENSELVVPNKIIKKLDNKTLESINSYRQDIINVLNNKDNRLVVVVGPCSIHDVSVALEYAEFLKNIKNK